MVGVGSEQISAATLAASSPLVSIPAAAQHAWLQAADAPVRMQLDGSAASASTGLVLTADGPVTVLPRESLDNARFILESGSPTLNVIYFGAEV